MENKYFMFQVYIRPILDYNLVFYYPRTRELVSLLEKVQRRFTKYICPRGLSYHQRLELLNGMSIEKSYKIMALTTIYKILFCGFSVEGFEYKLFDSVTRGSAYKLSVPFCKTSVRKSFPLLRHIQTWNALQPKPKDLLSLTAFRHFLTGNVHETQA